MFVALVNAPELSSAFHNALNAPGQRRIESDRHVPIKYGPFFSVKRVSATMESLLLTKSGDCVSIEELLYITEHGAMGHINSTTIQFEAICVSNRQLRIKSKVYVFIFFLVILYKNVVG